MMIKISKAQDQEIRAQLYGFALHNDHLWQLQAPNGTIYYLAEYNSEITGYQDTPLDNIGYGGNSYYVLHKLCPSLGWKTQEVMVAEDHHDNLKIKVASVTLGATEP